MSDDLGILRSIIEEPDDLSHRLILADWMEENDEARWSELIRIQCGLSQLLTTPEIPFQVPVFLDVRDLQSALWRSMLAPFVRIAPFMGDPDITAPEAILTQGFGFWVRRGLIEGLDIYGGQNVTLLARDLPLITENVPLQHIRFFPRSHRNTIEARSDYLRAHTLRVLLDQPFISRLRTLDLAAQPLNQQGAECLLRFRERLHLTRLHLNGPGLTDPMRNELSAVFGEALEILPRESDDIPF